MAETNISDTEVENITCYCGGSTGERLRTHIRGDKQQPIARCQQCGVVQKATLDASEHHTFHKEGGQAEEINLDSLSDSYKNRNLTDVVRRVKSIRPLLNGDEQLLDFGTGMGHFLDAIDLDVDMVVGSEINEERLAFIRQELGFDVYEGTDDLLEAFPDNSFDVVTMFHTLEHLPEPVEQLKHVRRLLDDDGILIVEVPNHDDWLLSVSEAYADFYYQDAHAYYFDPRTLENVFHRAGFDVQVRGAQRYSYRNALHWIMYGEPELNAPSRFDDSGYRVVERTYGTLLKTTKKSDTIVAQGSPQ